MPSKDWPGKWPQGSERRGRKPGRLWTTKTLPLGRWETPRLEGLSVRLLEVTDVCHSYLASAALFGGFPLQSVDSCHAGSSDQRRISHREATASLFG